MAKNKTPVTAAIRALRQEDIKYSDHLYSYEEKGGTAASARELGIAEHTVIKTLVMEDERGNPLIILMHGDREVSTKNLAREIGCKQVNPCDSTIAEKHTGYQVGGTSPFGTRKTMTVYAEESIFDLDIIYINGGKRGYLLGLQPDNLKKLLTIKKVNVAIK